MNEDIEEIQRINQELIELGEKLSDEEYTFCETYLKNITSPVVVAVAKALPYEDNPVRRGQMMLSNIHVLRYLDLRRKVIRRAWITKDDVLIQAYDLWQKSKEPIPVIDRKGQPTGEYKFDSHAAVKLAELLFKYTGAISEADKGSKANITVAPSVNIARSDLDAALEQFNAEY